MTFKKIVSILLFIVTFSLISCGSSKDSIQRGLSNKQKIKDFQYLYNTIKENYPFIQSNNRTNNINWLTKEKEYLDSVKNTTSDEEFVQVLNNILNDLNDTYTKMIIGDEINFYIETYSNNAMIMDIINNPKVQEKYSDYIESDSTDKSENFSNIGSENIITKDLVSNEIAYISIDKMLDIEHMDEDIQILDNYIEKIKEYNALVIDLRGSSGLSNDYWQYYLLPKLVRDTLKSTTYSFIKNENMLNTSLNENELISLDIKMVSNLDKNKVPNLPKEIVNEFMYYKLHETTVSPRNSISFQGRIYLLVDENTSEAAESMAIFSKQSGFATLIGQNMLGKSLIGDPVVTMLPHSNYVFSFMKDFPTMSDGTSITEFQIAPNYEIIDTNKTPELNKDNCISKVLELEGLNADSTLSITPKEFTFDSSLEYIVDYEEKYNDIYNFIGNLLTKYNGEITLSDTKDNLEFKFRKQYDTNSIFSLTYDTPTKISIQSNYINIPPEGRDRFSNLCITVTKISVVCLENENRIIIKLLGENQGIILEFYDHILVNELSTLLDQSTTKEIDDTSKDDVK